jgi:hypothetical protein
MRFIEPGSRKDGRVYFLKRSDMLLRLTVKVGKYEWDARMEAGDWREYLRHVFSRQLASAIAPALSMEETNIPKYNAPGYLGGEVRIDTGLIFLPIEKWQTIKDHLKVLHQSLNEAQAGMLLSAVEAIEEEIEGVIEGDDPK